MFPVLSNSKLGVVLSDKRDPLKLYAVHKTD